MGFHGIIAVLVEYCFLKKTMNLKDAIDFTSCQGREFYSSIMIDGQIDRKSRGLHPRVYFSTHRYPLHQKKIVHKELMGVLQLGQMHVNLAKLFVFLRSFWIVYDYLYPLCGRFFVAIDSNTTIIGPRRLNN